MNFIFLNDLGNADIVTCSKQDFGKKILPESTKENLNEKGRYVICPKEEEILVYCSEQGKCQMTCDPESYCFKGKCIGKEIRSFGRINDEEYTKILRFILYY